MNSLLTVEKPDGFPVGMICKVVSAPDIFCTRPGELVRIRCEATQITVSWDDSRNAPFDPPVTAYGHRVIRLTPPPGEPGPLGDGLIRYWCYVTMLRPATPEEIAEAGLPEGSVE